ncbi:hypothetical protein ACMFMG_011800 [Clarireedia jacksonii]
MAAKRPQPEGIGESQPQKRIKGTDIKPTSTSFDNAALKSESLPIAPTSQPSQICSVCRGLNPQHFDSSYQRELIRIKDINKTTACWGCELLLRVVDWIPHRNKEIDGFTDCSYDKILPKVKLEELALKISYHGYGGLCIEFQSCSNKKLVKNQILIYAEGVAWKDFCLGRSPHFEDPWSFWMNVSLSWAKEKIGNCKMNHPVCKPRDHALPKRVLDLGPPETTDYRENQFKTTRINIDEHKKQITLVNLPKTFQDAIIISRNLGIRYLWIDSLCITQDDMDDWRQEASKMAQIYQCSTLCIAASSSSDDAGGLQDTFRPLGHLGIVRSGSIARKVFVHRSVQELPSVYHDLYNNLSGPFSRLPLLRRGWVLQERLLAPRFLQFAGHRGIFLECMYATVSEDGYDTEAGQSGSCEKISHFSALSEGSQERLSSRWHLLVSSFSGLELTQEDDVLPAISGLAHQHGEYRKCQYFAGLWEDSFILDLMWSSRNWEVVKRPKPKRWRAPSWSWASVNDNTSYVELWRAGKDVTLQCSVTEVHCVPVLDNTMGQLASGWAKLSGLLSPASLTRVSSEYSAQYSLQNLSRFDLSGQVFPDPCIFPDDGTSKITQEVFYFHLGCTTSTYIGLALRRSDKDSFERLGLIKLDRSSIDPFIGGIQALGDTLTITII